LREQASESPLDVARASIVTPTSAAGTVPSQGFQPWWCQARMAWLRRQPLLRSALWLRPLLAFARRPMTTTITSERSS